MSLPIAEKGLGFYLILDMVRQCGEEIDACECLHLVDSAQLLSPWLALAVVVEDERKSARLWLCTIDDFEEAIGHPHLVLAYETRLRIAAEDWSANDGDGPIATCPRAALFLQLVPVFVVKTMVLRADVGHEKRLRHGFLIPFIVARRAHVATVKPRVIIILESGTGRFHLGIFLEAHIIAPLRPCRVLAGQRPSHPVGGTVLMIIRCSVSLSLNQLVRLTLWHALNKNICSFLNIFIRFRRHILACFNERIHSRISLSATTWQHQDYQHEQEVFLHFQYIIVFCMQR